MKWSVVILLCIGMMSMLWSQDKPVAAAHRGMSRQLAMMDAEREEYAGHLASHAANLLAGGAEVSAVMVERFLVVAKLLSPRNKRAVVVDFQRERKVKPERVAGAFTATSLARLLLTRGKLLLDQEGVENQWMGRAFLKLAAEMDPKNEDAVYSSVVDDMENGVFDWNPPASP